MGYIGLYGSAHMETCNKNNGKDVIINDNDIVIN